MHEHIFHGFDVFREKSHLNLLGLMGFLTRDDIILFLIPWPVPRQLLLRHSMMGRLTRCFMRWR
jgi:hypothetical protein